MWFFRKKRVISTNEKAEIERAIQLAEQQTSGEIKVIIDQDSKQTFALDDVKSIFAKHQLYATEQRNAVLFLISLHNRQFFIYGDEGIHQKLGESYWKEIVDVAIHTIKAEKSWINGLCLAIGKLGDSLKKHYPLQKDDKNELSNTVDIL